MVEAAKSTADIYRELGPLAYLIVIGSMTFVYLVWRIVQAQDKIVDTQAAIAAKMSEHDARGCLIQQNQELMHGTCRDHGDKIDSLHSGMIEFKSEVTEELSELKSEVKVLKERVG